MNKSSPYYPVFMIVLMGIALALVTIGVYVSNLPDSFLTIYAVFAHLASLAIGIWGIVQGIKLSKQGHNKLAAILLILCGLSVFQNVAALPELLTPIL